MNVGKCNQTNQSLLCCISSGSHCTNPPAPPAESNLLLFWNSEYPPAHNETVLYKCNAGKHHNRFIEDYMKDNYTLTCLQDNQFSEPEWPTCADCEYWIFSNEPFLFTFLLQDTTCPNPKDLNSSEIIVDESSITYTGRLNYTENIWYLLSNTITILLWLIHILGGNVKMKGLW